MKPLRFMLVAGETSGDALAAELVRSIRAALCPASSLPHPGLPPGEFDPQFFGLGGSAMAEAGVRLACDLTDHAVVGLSEVLRDYRRWRRLFKQALELAIESTPDVIVLVDFGGFNRRLARAIRRQVRSSSGTFNNWNPRIVQYISPQVWASRPGRARQLARDLDLLLSIFPFEKAWYARRTPSLPIEFVGNPLLDRYAAYPPGQNSTKLTDPPTVTLLPGSREGELRRHLPVILHAAGIIRAHRPVNLRMVVPNERLHRMVLSHPRLPPGLKVQRGELAAALASTTVAVASTGTVTMECAYFGVPTVAIYKTSWTTYEIGKRLVHVRHLAMPNILAGESVFPELIQGDATPERIAQAAVALLKDEAARNRTQKKLARVIRSLGTPGATRRAAEAILQVALKSGELPA